MPTATHQAFVLLFRNHPAFAFELAGRAGAPLHGDYEQFEKVDAEFDDPLRAGNTVRADLAVVGQFGELRRGLVLEVQLGIDPDKEWTIALYRAALRRRERCSAWALVVSPEPKVRASFRERMFGAEPELRPHVVTPEMIPIIRDLDTAIANYPWAVLAAAFHATGPDAVLCATLAIRALLEVAPEDYGRYIQMISELIGENVMQQVREQLPPDDEGELSELERRGSAFTRGHREGFEEGVERGLEQGLERGLEQGLEQGIEQGLEALRTALCNILTARGLPIHGPTLACIAACSTIDELAPLLERAATITSAEELFSSRAGSA
jgi:hypothetical protein